MDERSVETGETSIFIRSYGSGPPLLLLHGFPQTGLMWRDVAQLLATDFTVICADLRGYGESGCPESSTTHEPYSKRVMARDMVGLMKVLGISRFAVAGHDRGGRVAYRMALDSPHSVDRLAVLDVLPTSTTWEHADNRFALAYWPWSILAQDEPLPERVLTSVPDAIVASALGGWGSPPETFPPRIRDAYVAALRDPRHAHAICEEYRAAAGIDRDHDNADRTAGNRISCDTLVLWSESGPLGTWYRDEGGPLALWREWAATVEGYPMRGGHFFPEELPAVTAERLRRFFVRGSFAARP